MKDMQKKADHLMKTTNREITVNGDVGEEEDEGVLYDGTEDVSYVQGNYQSRSLN